MQANTGGATGASARTRLPWRLMIAATLIALGTVVLLWLAAVPVGSGVCPAIDPAPTNCLPSYRAGSGLVATTAVVAVWVATILVALVRTPAGRVLAGVGVAVLALSPFVAYPAVAWSPGFTLTAPAPATGDPVGRWGEAGERSAHLIVFEDGTMRGNDGCNGVSGRWSRSGDVVEFSDVFMTLVMCPARPSDLRGPIVTAVVQGDLLHVFDADGNTSGVLARVTEAARS